MSGHVGEGCSDRPQGDPHSPSVTSLVFRTCHSRYLIVLDILVGTMRRLAMSSQTAQPSREISPFSIRAWLLAAHDAGTVSGTTARAGQPASPDQETRINIKLIRAESESPDVRGPAGHTRAV